MQHLFPPKSATAAPARVDHMEHVRACLTVHGPAYLLQALRTLETHLNHASLETVPATRAWIDLHYPKSRRGVHPRPDLGQSLNAYKKMRADLIRAVEIATGVRAAKQERRSREDGWAELLAAVKAHTNDGGLIHPAAAGPLARLADLARGIGLEPWQLADGGVITRLQEAFVIPSDRRVVRDALQTLIAYGFIPEIAAFLPEAPVPALPTLRTTQALPDQIDSAILEMVRIASIARDDVSGQDSASVCAGRSDRFRAALRHHVRRLPECQVDPELGYDRPVTDLDAVIFPADLFGLDHVKATIRRTEALEHLPGTLSQASASSYYSDQLVVLSRNGLLDDEFHRQIKSSRFLQEGRELANGMRPATKRWCEKLLCDPERERRFRNMHRILQARVEEIFDAARAAGRDPFDPKANDLTTAEVSRIRAAGTAAAAAAIEFAGRPIRMNNVLNLRMFGSRANFFRPGRDRADFGFVLPAQETKSGEEEPFTILQKELHGPQVLHWYLRRIRPLFPHAAGNIHLFPAVETPGQPLCKGTFDLWFQRAAAEAGLPMTFHRWRHGYASLLIDESWDNLQVAANMLGNTVGVCSKSYAWIDKKKLYLAGQDRMIARARRQK